MKKHTCKYLMILMISTGLMFLAWHSGKWKTTTPMVAAGDTIIDTVMDTVMIQKPVYVPRIIYRDTGTDFLMAVPVDTMRLLRDYLSRVVVCDTLVNSARAFVAVTDTLWRNRIIARRPDIRLYNRDVVRTIPVMTPHNHLYLGLMAGGIGDRPLLGASATLDLKQRQLISISYDMGNKGGWITWSWRVD